MNPNHIRRLLMQRRRRGRLRLVRLSRLDRMEMRRGGWMIFGVWKSFGIPFLSVISAETY